MINSQRCFLLCLFALGVTFNTFAQDTRFVLKIPVFTLQPFVHFEKAYVSKVFNRPYSRYQSSNIGLNTRSQIAIAKREQSNAILNHNINLGIKRDYITNPNYQYQNTENKGLLPSGDGFGELLIYSIGGLLGVPTF